MQTAGLNGVVGTGRRLLFVVGSALGHLGRALVVARVLRRRQPSVALHFACPLLPADQRALVAGEFALHDLPGPPSGAHDAAFADALEALFEQFVPDLILLDLSPLPWLALVRFPPVARVYLTNGFLTELGRGPTAQDEWWAQWSAAWNRMREGRGLRPLASARELYRADRVLLADPPALLPAVTAQPMFETVGPCVWEADGSVPSALAGDAQLLVLMMGSTGQQQMPEAVVMELMALVGADRAVFIASQGAPYGPRVTSLRWVPLTPLLRRARFAVTQGGAGNLYLALAAGVPVGCLPTHANHRLLGALVEDLGVGMLFTGRHWSRELAALGPALVTLRKRAQAMAGELQSVDGPARAAECILALLEQGLSK